LIILKGDNNSQREGGQSSSSNLGSFIQSNQNDGGHFSDELDESIIQSIVTKLGYTSEEVKRYVREENSFVSVLYSKIAEE
jgi:hypothetical protein